MEVVANLWWLWLIIAFVFFAVGMWNIFRRAKGLITKEEDEGSVIQSILSSLIWFLFAGLSAVFFLIGIIIKIIEFAKQ